MITLINVYYEDNRHDILYRLLGERTTEQSISHKGMPDFPEHVEFVESMPYLRWCFIHSSEEDDYVGAIYQTKRNEIGVTIFNKYQRKGYGQAAIKELVSSADPLPAIPSERAGHYIANINPHNTASIKMFEGLGFKHIMNTYRLD